MTVSRSTRPSFDSRVRGSLRTPRTRDRRHDVLAIATAALVNERFVDARFTIAALGRELRVPALSLRLRFRRFYGLSLDEHLASRRLELAEILMTRSAHRVGALDQVARESGYRSAEELDRDFLRYRGTPALAAWFRRGPSRRRVPDPV